MAKGNKKGFLDAIKEGDLLGSLIFVLDQFFSGWIGSRKFITDFYDDFAAIDHFTIRLRDGSLASFLRSDGFSETLSKSDKYKKSQQIASKLDAQFGSPGFTLQIVDWCSPDVKPKKIKKMLQPSLDELDSIGISSDAFSSDYIEFLSRESRWSEQFIVVMTSPSALSDEDIRKNPHQFEDKVEKAIQSIVGDDFSQQAFATTPREKALQNLHETSFNSVITALSESGVLVEKMTCNQLLLAQSEALWGNRAPDQVQIHAPSKWVNNSAIPKFPSENLKVQYISEQVLLNGISHHENSLDTLKVHDRFAKTLVMTVPQLMSNNLYSFEDLISRLELPDTVSYIQSSRLSSNPFQNEEVRENLMQARICSVVPFTENAEIKRSLEYMMEQHAKKIHRSALCQYSITIISESETDLNAALNIISTNFKNNGQAILSPVEIEPMDGIFSSIPGAAATPRLNQIVEYLDVCLYMSAIFADCQLYRNGFLTFLTPNKRPFTLEEHSPRNINFNSFTAGQSGTGKSTLLSMQTLGFIAKPKLFAEMSGEIPITMCLDSGKTSFGINRMIKSALLESYQKTKDIKYYVRSKQVLSHVMTLDKSSAWNPHDLQVGRYAPTQAHQQLLSTFLACVFFGVSTQKSDDNEQSGKIVVNADAAMLDCLSILIKAVYDYRSPRNHPHTFKSNEFNVLPEAPKIIKLWLDLGIIPSESDLDSHLSYANYYELAQKTYDKGIKRKISPVILEMYVIYILRFAYPRISDYGDILSNNGTFRTQYANYIDIISKGLTSVVQKYPCFTGPTLIDIDLARLISVDIENLIMHDDSGQYRSVLGTMGLMMFFLRRESSKNAPELLEDNDNIDPVLRPLLEKFDEMNCKLPSIFNLEEAHILMKLMNDRLCNYQRINRRANWGLKAFTQQLTHPSEEYLELCSTVWFSSDMADTTNRLRRVLNVAEKAENYIKSGIGTDPTSFFVIIKTKKSDDGPSLPVVATPLKLVLPPSLLWASNADSADAHFLNLVVRKFGFAEGMKKLAQYLPTGRVKSFLAHSLLLDAVKKHGNGITVSDMLMGYLETGKRPHYIPDGILPKPFNVNGA